jgi:hypothetical protein
MVLTEDTLGLSSVIIPRAGVVYQGHQFSPAVRAVSEPRAGGDGTSDLTANLDAGAFSLNLVFPGGDRSLIDEIGAFLDPSLRPVLTVTDSGWSGDRQLILRFDSGSPPVELGTGLRRNWQVQWVVPAGKWQAADPVLVTVAAFIESSTGLVYDTTGVAFTSAGLSFPATSAVPPTQTTNPGGMKCGWTGRLYGPAAGPKLATDIPGLGITRALEWGDDTVLNAGDYIYVDSDQRIALLNGESDVSGDLIFDSLDWWPIRRGPNTIRYYPSSAGAAAQAQLSYLPAWAI